MTGNGDVKTQGKALTGVMKKPSAFRKWVTADGSSGFPAEAGRYHLYLGLACPFALRTFVYYTLKGFEDVISYTIVDWLLGEKGWSFTDKKPRCSLDTVNKCQYLREVYELVDPAFNGKITVPILWDKKTMTIVSNDSTDILRMLTKEFNAFCKTEDQRKIDLYPADLADEIDIFNDWITLEIVDTTFKAGFARTQAVYDEGVAILFKALDKVEIILSKQRYLTGARLTEADVCLFTIVAMFDGAAVSYLKLNKKRIVDYPNLWAYTRDIYQTGNIATTVEPLHVQRYVQDSYPHLNPYGIVAIGPDIDFTTPHNRENMV